MLPYQNRIFVSDVDGTLADVRDIPGRNLEAINAFTFKGGIFTLCTGRNYGGVRDILQRALVNAPVITLNGGCLYDHHAGEEICHIGLPEDAGEIVAPIIDRFPRIAVLGVTRMEYFILRDGRPLYAEVEKKLDTMVRQRGFLSCAPADLPRELSKYVFEIPAALAGELVDFCNGLGRPDLSFLQTADNSLEVMSREATKGRGLVRLAEHLGIGLDRTGAVGDHYNDLDLLQTAGWGAAVHGSPEALVQAADYVTCPFAQGAVADALERYMAIIDGGRG